MGFSTIATIASTAAAVAPKVVEASAASAQEKSLKQAADTQEFVANRQAAAIEATASANQMRGSRNAAARLGSVRVDAAASNTAQEGSTYRRGVDLATRLQDEINIAANEQLERASHIRVQGALDALDLRNQAKQSRLQGIGATVSGLGTIISSAASALGGTAGSALAAKGAGALAG